FFIINRSPPISTLFPYTTLFRSEIRLLGHSSQLFLMVLNTRTAYRAASTILAACLNQISSSIFHSPPEAIDFVWRISWEPWVFRSEEHTSELQSRSDLVCRLLLE